MGIKYCAPLNIFGSIFRYKPLMVLTLSTVLLHLEHINWGVWKKLSAHAKWENHAVWKYKRNKYSFFSCGRFIFWAPFVPSLASLPNSRPPPPPPSPNFANNPHSGVSILYNIYHYKQRLLTTCRLLCRHFLRFVKSGFYATNFEEVEEAYWFGPVRPSVRLSVRNTFWQLRNSRTAYAKILYVACTWKISGPVFFPPLVLSFLSYVSFSTMYEQPFLYRNNIVNKIS